MPSSQQIHASCVSIGGKGVLLLGDSGSGKSDLALRLIDNGARLVADDYVDIWVHEEGLMAAAPEKLSGLLEVRGVGLLTLPAERQALLALAVQLAAREAVERLPEAAFWGCLGQQVPLLSLHAFDSSTDAKIRAALQYQHKG